jgi:hypothetical protein
MPEKFSIICASILFATIPMLLLYLMKSPYRDSYEQSVKDLPPAVVRGDQNIDNSTHDRYQFAPSLGGK